MKNNNRAGMKSTLIICFVMGTIVFSSGCSKHLSPSAQTAKSTNSESARTPEGKSLIGTWVLDKIEAPDLTSKLASFGSQADVDRISKTLDKYKDALKGLTVTFSEDGTYQSAYNGQSDLGKWSVNETNEIRAVSKVSNSVELYQIVSQTETSIKAQINQQDVNLLLTFIKK